MAEKVLVTGASGFLGARLVRKLIEQGEHVKALVRATSSLRALDGIPRENLEIVQGDVMIAHTVYRSLAGCDRLFHVAAVNQLWDPHPAKILDAAIVGTEQTLEAAYKKGISKVVYTSSAGVLGTTGSEPMDESHGLNLSDPETYIEAKVKAEERALSFYSEKGLPVVVVNPSVIVGPGDFRPTPAGAGILRYLEWSYPFGFPTVAGGLSVVDVDDVAEGHILAMQKGRPGERYILGGENLDYEQMFTLLSELTGLEPPGKPVSQGMAELGGRLSELYARWSGKEPLIGYRSARDFAGANSWVSSEKAERELGYTHRSARKALLRQVQFFLEKRLVSTEHSRRIRVDLRAVA
jgi:dihydroflavonol-4-reductase